MIAATTSQRGTAPGAVCGLIRSPVWSSLVKSVPVPVTGVPLPEEFGAREMVPVSSTGSG